MQMKNLAVLIALPVALVACGGDSGSSSGGGGIVAPGTAINSQFIDAPVKGLKVAKTSGNGETGANGVFSCKAGEELTFWLKAIGVAEKGLSIGKAFCGSHIYLDDLGADAVKAGALIQSLSTGDHGTRKELDLSAFNATTFDISGVTLSALNDGAISAVVNDVVSANASLVIEAVTLTQARQHMDTHLPKQDDAVLESISGVEHTLNLIPLASNPATHCYENIRVKVALEPIATTDTSGGKAYRFNVNEYLAYDGETVPTYTSNLCDGTEHSTGPNEYFQCLNNPVSKIMTGRTVSGAQYAGWSFAIPQGSVAICKHSEGYEFNYDEELGVQCKTEDQETPILAANNLKIDVGQGWNFSITVTDSSYTVNFTENAVDIGAVLDASGKATAYTQQKFNCSYSLTESLK